MPDPRLELLSDPTRVCPAAAKLLRIMVHDDRPAYAWASALALDGLDQRTLVGIQSSWSRFWITLYQHNARPAPCSGGAIFQAIPSGDVRRLVGWIVLDNHFRGGSLVLVHEIGHWIFRHVVDQLAHLPAPCVDAAAAAGFDSTRVQMTRAQLLNELAARHLAWLAESGADPGARPLPQPGALFACALKIARYPAIYNDCGVMVALLARHDDDLLRDQVGQWIHALTLFAFFHDGSLRADEHARWLTREIELARRGRDAPRVQAEGTL